jgi:hypothetical protein
MQDLQSKTVLFLAPKFFGYDQEIKKELEDLGTETFLYDERPKNDFSTKVLLRLNLKSLIQKKIDAYYDNIIRETEDKDIDYLFLVNAETIDTHKINKIKELHPNIKIYTYMWDSIKNKKKSMQYLPLSDKFFTFDPNDIKIDSKIKFLPLFYIRDYEHIVTNESCDYDISFVGTIHSDRYQVVKGIQTAGLKVFYYFFSPSKILFKLQQLLHKNFREIEPQDIDFELFKKEQLLDVISKSKSIIDIEHPDQKGLTMRTMEMIGAKKKLITTNSNIKEYDFYTPENICVIDRTNPKVPHNFLENDYKELPIEIYEKYSLKSWIGKIFS